MTVDRSDVVLAEGAAAAQPEASTAVPRVLTPSTRATYKISKAVMKRRAFEIHAYIGSNGGGKSLCMVRDSIPSLLEGRPVVSTVPLLDPATGLPHPLWVPLDDYRTLLDAEHCDVLLDEVTGIASSRASAGMPSQVEHMLVQLRRRDVVLRWTAPSWKRADTIIRECSRAVTLCQGFRPHTVSDGSAMWRPRRTFYWRTYDAQAFEEWSLHQKEKKKAVAREIFNRAKRVDQHYYDTLGSVLTLGHVTEGGSCVDCGGKRLPRKCTCKPSTLDLLHPGDAVAALGRPLDVDLAAAADALAAAAAARA